MAETNALHPWDAATLFTDAIEQQGTVHARHGTIHTRHGAVSAPGAPWSDGGPGSDRPEGHSGGRQQPVPV